VKRVNRGSVCVWYMIVVRTLWLSCALAPENDNVKLYSHQPRSGSLPVTSFFGRCHHNNWLNVSMLPTVQDIHFHSHDRGADTAWLYLQDSHEHGFWASHKGEKKSGAAKCSGTAVSTLRTHAFYIHVSPPGYLREYTTNAFPKSSGLEVFLRLREHLVQNRLNSPRPFEPPWNHR